MKKYEMRIHNLFMKSNGKNAIIAVSKLFN